MNEGTQQKVASMNDSAAAAGNLSGQARQVVEMVARAAAEGLRLRNRHHTALPARSA